MKLPHAPSLTRRSQHWQTPTHLHNLTERRNQRLSQPKRERQLRPRHQQLRRQALEETQHPLVPRHVGHDAPPALPDLEVAVLDARLDDVEGRGDEDGGAGARDGGAEVLGPGRAVVVLEVEEVLFRGGGASE